MVCKKSIIAKILIVLAVFMVLFCSIQVCASNDVIGTKTFEFEGYQYPYYLVKSVSNAEHMYVFSNEVYFLPVYYSGDYSSFFRSFSPTEISVYTFRDDAWVLLSTVQMNYNDNGVYPYSVYLKFDNFNYNTVSSGAISDAFSAYMRSDSFQPIETGVDVDWLNSKPNYNFALQNVRGSVSDDVFTATWTLPELMPNAEMYPVLVDFTITDLATNEKTVYSYPAVPDVYGALRKTYYDVNDLTLSVDLTDIKDLPTDFRVDFATLTPYYEWVGEHSSMPIFYKGQSSSIYLNYSGHFDFVVQTPPDDPITDVNDEQQTEKGILVSIQNFFSGFFTNFGNMLKNLFIPTKEDIIRIYNQLDAYFSEKLGFIWYPFDLAVDLLACFADTEQDGTLTVPSMNFDILGGISIYDGGTFEIDATGIFVYVRYITSILICCALAGLAYNKWSDIVKGE